MLVGRKQEEERDPTGTRCQEVLDLPLPSSSLMEVEQEKYHKFVDSIQEQMPLNCWR